MYRRILWITLLLWLVCLLPFASSTAQADPKSGSTVTLEEIGLGLPAGQTLKGWYEARSGNTGDSDYFGAYITLPVGSDLYLGLGSARPAENSGDGSYFARFDGSNLVGIAEPNEQGLHEMIYDGSLVHIAGTDPHPPDDHSAGNHYTYEPGGAFTKYRDAENGLLNVYHTWGLWKSGTTLYAVVSSHDGTDPVDCTYGVDCMGQVFASTDNGASWTHRSDLGEYRAYDITGFDGDLYALYNNELGGALTAVRSKDGGLTWGSLRGLAGILGRVHMVEFNNLLIMVSFDGRTLYALDTSDHMTGHTLPDGYRAGVTYDEAIRTDYNIMAVAKGYLYLIAETGSPAERAVLRTQDLINWERIVYTLDPLVSLSYWPVRDWLVLASPGTEAKLWKVDLSSDPTAITLQAFQVHSPATALLTIGVIYGLVALYFAFRTISRRRS